MPKAVFSAGNQLTLLQSGVVYFALLVEAITAARHEIRLESYIFEDDDTGRRIAAALASAARRGVRVHVLVDGFGSAAFMRTLGDALRRDGVEVLVYRPELELFRLRKQRLRRMHRKLVCIDTALAFVGGINIIDDLDRDGNPRLDYAVRVEGPLLASIHRTMVKLWELVRWASFGKRYRATPITPAHTAHDGNVSAALLVRDNLRNRHSIENAYLVAIHAARHEIIIANAYFLPGQRFRHALMAAAQRGVTVTLLLEGRVEYYLQYFATQALYAQLLQAGIRIYEYKRGFLHAKVAVIDKDWATVGSSNIDPFSLLLAREANVLVRDAAFATELRRSLSLAITEGSVEIHDRINLPWHQRLRAWLSYSLVRALIGLVGYNKLSDQTEQAAQPNKRG
jgi:cardiolipin synthase